MKLKKENIFLKTHRAWFQEELKVKYSVKDEIKQRTKISHQIKKKRSKGGHFLVSTFNITDTNKSVGVRNPISKFNLLSNMFCVRESNLSMYHTTKVHANSRKEQYISGSVMCLVGVA